MDGTKYMERALKLAKLGWATALPNPMVGAVLVKDGAVIGEGAHLKDGGAHAEIECLRSVSRILKCSEAEAKSATEGATLYVTLEPCSTCGRTGACTDAIIAAKIGEVQVAALDPNPVHSGRGIEILRAGGVKCEAGLLADKAEKLNFIFNYSITQKKALVALKCAMSSDGKIAIRKGVRTSITGEDARANMMEWRAHFPAIGVGAATVAADDPSLSSRAEERPDICGVRFIFDSHLTLADYHKVRNLKSFKVFSDGFSPKTFVVCGSDADQRREETLTHMGINIFKLAASRADESAFWNEFKCRLYSEMGLSGIMVEGGAGVYKSLWEAQAADYAFIYRSRLPLGSDAFSAFEDSEIFPIPVQDEFVKFPNGDTLTRGKADYK